MQLREFRVSKEEHKKRTETHLKKGKALKESYELMTQSDWDHISEMYAYANYPHSICLASDPMFAKWDFGAVGTIQSAGCVVFVTAYIIAYYKHRSPDLISLAGQIAEKGYRSWRFKNYPQLTFTSKMIKLEDVKKELKSVAPEVEKCKTLDELYKIVGNPEGVGGAMYLIDNVIHELSKGSIYDDMRTILEKTRLSSIYEIVENLISGFMVPIRVNNRIYHDDPKREGGHYVILIGLENGEVTVLDSSIGFKKLPFKRLMEAAVADKGLIAAWDLSCI